MRPKQKITIVNRDDLLQDSLDVNRDDLLQDSLDATFQVARICFRLKVKSQLYYRNVHNLQCKVRQG
jgi:hypothetical protein